MALFRELFERPSYYRSVTQMVKFGQLFKTFISRIEVRNMIADYSKPTKL